MVKFIFQEEPILIEIFNQAIKLISNVAEIKSIILAFHTTKIEAHKGIALTYANIATHYRFKNMRKIIKSVINDCLVCQSRKNKRKNKVPLAHVSLGQDFGDLFFLDMIGPLAVEKTSNDKDTVAYKLDATMRKKYILSCVDSVTRFVFAAIVDDLTSDSIAKKMVVEIFLKYAIPKCIVVDNASNLTSNCMKSVCKLLQIHHKQITVYNPNSNLVEIVNKNINEKLRCLVDKSTTNWPELLPYVVYSINTAINTSTGFSPFYLLYARTPRNLHLQAKHAKIYTYEDFAMELKYRINQLKEIAAENNENRRAKNKTNYDIKAKPVELKVGDLVFVDLPPPPTLLNKKLRPKRQGPYLVTEIISETIVSLQVKDNKTKNFHKNILHKYEKMDESENSSTDE